MRIGIWASVQDLTPEVGPYKTLDTVEMNSAYKLGDMTHYGEVIKIVPAIPPFTENEQNVIVKLDLAQLRIRPTESVFEPTPTAYHVIRFFPIRGNINELLSESPALRDRYSILPEKDLSIEDVSSLINDQTFATWKHGCFVSKGISDELEAIKYAVVHRYTAANDRDHELEKSSTQLLNLAIVCLQLVRPTRRSRAGRISGIVKADGSFDPHGFDASEPAEVPEVQKLFSIREKDIDLLKAALPELMKVYRVNERGDMVDEYEPLRMAIQLYEQAYGIGYWKARHILWWSAIEALFGSSEEAAMARIYALFGNKNLVDGFKTSIYDQGDIPSYYSPQSQSNRTLGEIVPIIYEVRNFSAHGRKVPDSHFSPVAHPFGQIVGIDTLAEAATFVVRKAIVKILLSGWVGRFKSAAERDLFWLYEFGLDKKQSAKRLREMYEILDKP